MQPNYLLMEKDDLVKEGVNDFRLGLASLLMSRGYDIAMIVLIIIYALLLVAYFIVEDIIADEDSLIS